MSADLWVALFWLALFAVVGVLVARRRRDVPSGPRVRVEQRRGQR